MTHVESRFDSEFPAGLTLCFNDSAREPILTLWRYASLSGPAMTRRYLVTLIGPAMVAQALYHQNFRESRIGPPIESGRGKICSLCLTMCCFVDR